MAVSLEEMQAGTGGEPPTTPTTKLNTDLPTVSLTDMQAEIPVEPKASWGDVIKDVPGLVGASAARTVAGLKLRALEELREGMTPAELRSNTTIEAAIERERAVIRETVKGTEEHTTPDMSTLQKGVQGGLVSVPMSAGALAVGIGTRNPALAAAAMYPVTAGEKYASLRDAGVKIDLARKHGDFQATVEVATELLPFAKLLNKSPIGRKLFGALVADVPGEILATYLQGASDVIAGQQKDGVEITADKVLSAVVGQTKEIPTTIIASLVGIGIQSGSMAGVNKLAGVVLESVTKKDKAAATDAFNELAALHPNKAGEVAAEVEKIDPMLAKYMKGTVDKWKAASEKDLEAVGQKAAKKTPTKVDLEAAIKEMTPDLKKVFAVKGQELKLLEEEVKGEVSKVTGKPFKTDEQIKAEIEAAIDQPGIGKPISITGLETLGEAGKAISENMRQSLWDSYSKGKTKMAGIEDPALKAARAAKVPVERKAFDAFLTRYGKKVGSPTPLKAQQARDAAKLASIFKQEVAAKTNLADGVAELHAVLEEPERVAPKKENDEKYYWRKKDGDGAVMVGPFDTHEEAARAAIFGSAVSRFDAARKTDRRNNLEGVGKYTKGEINYILNNPEEQGYSKARLVNKMPLDKSWEAFDEDFREELFKEDVGSYVKEPERMAPAPNVITQRDELSDRFGQDQYAIVPVIRRLSNIAAFDKSRFELDGVPLTTHSLADELLATLPPGPAKSIIRRLRDETFGPIPISPRNGGVLKRNRDGSFSQVANKGIYSPRANENFGIQIRVDSGMVYGGGSEFLSTFIHEWSHAVTADFIYSHPNDPRVQRLGKLLQTARELIPPVLDDMVREGTVEGYDPRVDYDFDATTDGDLYGLSDIYEFVAEANGNPRFMRLLAETARYDTEGLVKKLSRAISHVADQVLAILGIKGSGANLLQEVWDLSKHISELQAQWLIDKAAARGIDRQLAASPIRHAFDMGKATAEKVPGYHVSVGKLTEYWNQILNTVAPEALGPDAKSTGAILAKHVALEAHRTSMMQGRSKARREFWEKRPQDAARFIKGFEQGQKFGDPLLDKAAEAYRAWNKDMYDTEQKLGLEYEAVDNYLYHVFDDSEKVQRFFEKKYGMKWGDPRFIKDRTFDLYEEALAAGHKPKYTNPEDVMLARQHASDISRSRIETLQELEKYGLAKRIHKGEKLAPEGFSSSPRRSPNGGHYWVKEQAQSIVSNLYDTQSLWQKKGAVGDVFRGVMWLKNASVPFILGLSAFHALHVQTIDNATWMVRATKELLSGSLKGKGGALNWLAQMGKATFYRDIYSNPHQGSRILHLTQGRIPEGELTASDRMSLQFMAEGGFVPEMAHVYRTGAKESFAKAVREHSITAPFKLPFAVMDVIQGVMFQKWIPALKAASYIRDVKTALQTDPTLMEDPLRRMTNFRRIAKSVDNRYGEMAYNTLFWTRWVKDIGVASTLSLGWNLGFIREYGGAAIDLVTNPMKPESTKQQFATGEYDKAMFVLFYSIQSMAYAGLLHFLLSGDEPKELLDYTFPKNGEKNPDGTDQRVSTMFYPREFVAIYKHMEKEGVLPGLGQLAMNKTSPALSMISDWWTNTNYFGAEISDPNAPLYMRTAQKLAYTFTGLEPISVGTIREQVSANPIKTGIMAVAGFSPAPKYITETKTEGEIKHVFQKYYGSKQTPYERAEYSGDAKRLKGLFQLKRHGEFRDELAAMKEKYQLTPTEIARLRSRIKENADPTIKMFARLSWQQQKRLLDEMTVEERKVYLPHSNKYHLRRKYRPPEE